MAATYTFKVERDSPKKDKTVGIPALHQLGSALGPAFTDHTRDKKASILEHTAS